MRVIAVALRIPMALTAERTARRVDQQFARGLLDEMRGLAGPHSDIPIDFLVREASDIHQEILDQAEELRAGEGGAHVGTERALLRPVGFVHKHDVPYNPLHDRDYPSIGCWPCTRPVAAGEDDRAGRWAGKVKKECGLHVVEVKDGEGI